MLLASWDINAKRSILYFVEQKPRSQTNCKFTLENTHWISCIEYVLQSTVLLNIWLCLPFASLYSHWWENDYDCKVHYSRLSSYQDRHSCPILLKNVWNRTESVSKLSAQNYSPKRVWYSESHVGLSGRSQCLSVSSPWHGVMELSVIAEERWHHSRS